MATRIHLGANAGNREFDVTESFDEILEMCWPTEKKEFLSEESRIKWARDSGIFHTVSGDRVFIQNLNLVAIEENA